jgi:diguanylate cyclase (GGDEF)-like protein
MVSLISNEQQKMTPQTRTDTIALSKDERSLLIQCSEWFLARFRNTFVAEVAAEFPDLQHLREVVSLEGQIQNLIRTLTGESGDSGFLTSNGVGHALLKRIILTYRMEKATELERLREKTSNLEILELLDGMVEPLDALASRPWFRAVEPYRVPLLSDYLDLERIEKKAGQKHRLAEREYDEKFHILQAPSLFLPDLRYFREKCALRGTAVGVAFLDIDDFKSKFNSPHGETKVDRNVLPRFMRTLEAHLAFHGYAYRQGGDEYMILIPSISEQLAVAFLDELRHKLGTLTYPEAAERTTVSIGLCVADCDCPLTDRELRDKANLAEAFAKRAGRNCVATYRTNQLWPDDLYIAAPKVR